MTPGPPFAASGPARLSPMLGRFGGRTMGGRFAQMVRRALLTWASGSKRLRCADSRAASRAWIEPSAISHPGGRGAEGRRLPMGGAETHAVAPVLATNHRAPPASAGAHVTRLALGDVLLVDVAGPEIARLDDTKIGNPPRRSILVIDFGGYRVLIHVGRHRLADQGMRHRRHRQRWLLTSASGAGRVPTTRGTESPER